MPSVEPIWYIGLHTMVLLMTSRGWHKEHTWFWYTLNRIHCDAWLANASALTTNTVHRTMFKKTMARINERNVIERKAKRRSMYGEINQQTCIMLNMPRDSVHRNRTVQTLWNWFIHSFILVSCQSRNVLIVQTNYQYSIEMLLHEKRTYIYSLF